ncbi:MAG: hypothetical protein HYY40_13685 [Bacteroidetes bacterium]|nr:hypothetical protein [Bacteroidota bacterium]
MKTGLHKLLVALFCMVTGAILCQSQDLGRVRLQVLAGGNVPFAFNTIDKYENGISYPNYTIFGLTVEDTGAVTMPRDWEIEFRATNASGFIDGDAGNTLLFSTLRLTGSINAGFAGWGVLTYGPLDLTGADQIIAEDADMDDVPSEEPTSPTDQIAITYDCGTVVPLLGSPADFYGVDILFTFTVNF